MDLKQVIAVGRSGFLYTAIGITLALTVGITLGRWLHVQKISSFLISAGTAICGGSAIAAVAQPRARQKNRWQSHWGQSLY